MGRLFLMLSFLLNLPAKAADTCVPDFSEKRGCELTENQFQTIRFYLKCRSYNKHAVCLNRMKNDSQIMNGQFLGMTDGVIHSLEKNPGYREKFVTMLKEYADTLSDSPKKRAYLALIAVLATRKGVDGAAEVAGTMKDGQVIREVRHTRRPQDDPTITKIHYDSDMDPAWDPQNRERDYNKFLQSNTAKKVNELNNGKFGTLELNDEQKAIVKKFFDEMRGQDLIYTAPLDETTDVEVSRFHKGDERVRAMRIEEDFYISKDGELWDMGHNEVVFRAGTPKEKIRMAGPGLKFFGASVAVDLTLAAMVLFDREKQRHAACERLSPFVPMKGKQFDSSVPGYTPDCHEVWYEVEDKDWPLPPPLLQFFKLDEKQQRALLIYQSTNPRGICNYLSRAYDTAFQGTPMCTPKPSPSKAVEAHELSSPATR